jgi:asparagine synthetase B (glutamine-hydrolysing)
MKRDATVALSGESADEVFGIDTVLVVASLPFHLDSSKTLANSRLSGSEGNDYPHRMHY